MKLFNAAVFLFLTVAFISCNNEAPVGGQAEIKEEKKTVIELKTVKIGGSNWTVENLDTETFKNGDKIDEAKTPEEWIAASKSKKAAWCYYDNNKENGEKYGKLYNWYAVTDPRGLAPEGYHIPSVQELQGLKDAAYGDMNKAGKKLKSNEGWEKTNGDNESGFNALPAGMRNPDGEFSLIGKEAYYWSKDSSEDGAEAIFIIDADEQLRPHTDYKSNGFSVRILKD
jgi:uncharacterized protein (TIGR02145 family)